MKLADLFVDTPLKVLQHTGGCHSCPRKRREYLDAKIAPGAEVIFVMEAPTELEVRQQTPLLTNAGQKLSSVLKKNGIENYSVTYLTHCRPAKDGDAPGEKEISSCMNQYVQADIANHAVVVLVGNTVARAFFPKLTAQKLRGNVAWHPDFPGQRFYTIHNPERVLQNTHLETSFDMQIERLFRVVRDRHTPPFKLHRGSGAEAMAFLDWVLAQPLISFDMETTRLESWAVDAEIRGLAVTASEDAAYFVSADEPHYLRVCEKLKECFLNPKVRICGHNLGFDLEWFERQFGFFVRAEVLLDTQFLYYQLRSWQMVGLKELSTREADGFRYLVYEPHKERDNWLLGMYNAEDVVETFKLTRKALRELATMPKTLDLCLRIGGPAGLSLKRMTGNGIYYNLGLQKQIETNLNNESITNLENWKAFDPNFNPGLHLSDTGLEEYLFKICGLPVLTRTGKTNKPQINKANLKEWERRGFRVASFILKHREIDKKQSTYVQGYDKHIWPDGRIHPNFKITDTDSGRSAATDPNSQNVVRAQEIRSCYGVEDPENWVYVESDYNQVELRIAVCLANDPVGIKAYRDGDDLHGATARSFAGPNYTKEQRSRAKPVNFSLVYGGTAGGLQGYARDSYGIEFTMEEAEEFVRVFFSTYKRLPEWHEFERQNLRRNRGNSVSVIGHRFYYSEWNSEDHGKRQHAERSHLNSKCQGPAAQMLFYNIILAQRYLIEEGIPHKALLVNEVHDSIHGQVQKDALPDYIRILEKARGEVERWASNWLVVPLVMEHDAGPDWGTAKGLPF